MKVKQLIKELQKFKPHTEVYFEDVFEGYFPNRKISEVNFEKDEGVVLK
jgi:hypothetical protein